MAVTLDQIPAYLQESVGFLANITGKSAEELLRGHQFEILLLQAILGKISGSSGLLPPLRQPGQRSPAVPGSAFPLVDTQTLNVMAGSSFANFTPDFNGVAIIAITISEDAILSINETRINGTVSSNPDLLDSQIIPANQLKHVPIMVNNGVSYSLQIDVDAEVTVFIAGTTSLLAMQNPTISIADNQSVTANIDTSGGPVDVQFTSAQEVTINSGTVDATITGTVDVQFPSAQEVTLAATGPVDVQNTIIPAQNMVLLGYSDITVTNLANGSTVSTEVKNDIADTSIILTDGIIIGIYSAGSYQYEIGTDTLFFCRINDGFAGDSHYGDGPHPISANMAIAWQGNRGLSGPIWLASPYAGDAVLVLLYNNTGATIASDTVRVYAWAIKAQISNPDTNPANVAGNVSITSGTVDATIQNAQIDSNVINEILNTTNAFNIANQKSISVTNLTSGNPYSLIYMIIGFPIMANGWTLALASVGGNTYTVNVLAYYNIPPGNALSISKTYPAGTSVYDSGYQFNPSMINLVILTITPSAAVTSDTIDVSLALSTYSANMLDKVTPVYAEIGNGGTDNNVSILSSGGFVTSINLSVYNGNTTAYTCYIQNGQGITIYEVMVQPNSSMPITLLIPSGFSNNGLTANSNAPTNTELFVYGFITSRG